MAEVRSKTFVDLCIEGAAGLDEIDEYVSEWHKNPEGSSLHDFLGMRWDEYSLWVIEPDLLATIVAARRTGRPLASIAGEVRRLATAVRADDPGQAQRLTKWLESQAGLR